MYNSTTRHIQVQVEPRYLEEHSAPTQQKFFWAYTIIVENHGSQTVTLRSRYWKITDGHGRVQEIRGDGVVGEQPTLEPGQNFQYTSGCSLATPSGLMEGFYTMQTPTFETFEVAIPVFSLDSPHDRHSVN